MADMANAIRPFASKHSMARIAIFANGVTECRQAFTFSFAKTGSITSMTECLFAIFVHTEMSDYEKALIDSILGEELGVISIARAAIVLAKAGLIPPGDAFDICERAFVEYE